jgi:hypothetical protein
MSSARIDKREITSKKENFFKNLNEGWSCGLRGREPA